MERILGKKELQLLRKEENQGVIAILSGDQSKKEDVRNLKGKKTTLSLSYGWNYSAGEVEENATLTSAVSGIHLFSFIAML